MNIFPKKKSVYNVEWIEIVKKNIINTSNKNITISSNNINFHQEFNYKGRKINNINIEIFLIILFIHLLYLFLGFLIFLPLWCFYKDKTFKFLKAMHLFNFTIKCLIFNIFWLAFILIIYLIIVFDNSNFINICLGYYIVFYIIISINISIKYSIIGRQHFNKLINNNYDFKYFKLISFDKYNINNIDTVKNEIKMLYINNDIDKNNFYWSFFQNLTYIEENILKLKNNFFYAEFNNKLKIKYYSCENIFNFLLNYYHSKIDKYLFLKLLFFIIIINFMIFISLNYKYNSNW